MAESPFFWPIFGLYVAVGVYCLFWIKNDAEFRAGPWAAMAIPGIVLWPITLLVWLLIRGPEHLTSMAAKQSSRDFQIYMRTKKDKDLFVNFPKQVTAKKEADGSSSGRTVTISDQSSSSGADFKDLNIENLINSGKWEEALRAAKEMRKVAIHTQEDDRVQYYEGYIARIQHEHQVEPD